MTTVLKLLRASSPSDTISTAATQPQPTAIVFDSCPGHPTFSVMANAGTAGFKSPLAKNLAYIPAGMILFIFSLFSLRGSLFRLLGIGSASAQAGSAFEQLHKDLLDPAVIPPSAARLYVYSKPDLLVPAKHVEEHVAKARALEGEAKIERIVVKKYETGSHVNHMKADPEGYWARIHNLWLAQVHEPEDSLNFGQG
jgi:hypothetical protein